MKSRNFNAELVVGTSPGTADTEFAVTHSLGRAPVGAIVTRRSKAASFYGGTTANTATTAYFRTAGTDVVFGILLF